MIILKQIFLKGSAGRVLDFGNLGAIPDNDTYEAALHNGNLFNDTLNNDLKPGDTLLIPEGKTYWLTGGIKAAGMTDVTWQIDGTIAFNDDRETWPTNSDGDVEEAIYLENITNVIFTSSNGKGMIDGNGKKWWGAIDFLLHQEDRPRLLHIETSQNILMENLFLKDSAYWTFLAADSDGLIIRNTKIEARFTNQDNHNLIDLQAFNTDGVDVTGRNVHMYDCDIWVQDDCISVKDGSMDMLFERISCSGVGLVVGSIGSSIVRNITFRDSVMPNTFKGIYMKTRWSDSPPIGPAASISDVLYQNITMMNPEQYAIWIGPAQQTGQPCSLLWNLTPNAECRISGYQTWSNIVLRDIYITNPRQSPGVLLGNSSNPMQGIVFENVVVTNPGNEPFGSDLYYCEGIHGIAKGSTYPIPPCFKYVP